MKKSLLLLAVTAGAFGLSACTSDNPATLPPGKYEKTQSSTNAYGTKTEKKIETDVQYDEYGNKKATVKSKTSRDPKGLFNKSTTESETTYETR
ncbi:MAG: hypothetical protein WAO98_09780 [Alphaproteobacteria bacterium]